MHVTEYERHTLKNALKSADFYTEYSLHQDTAFHVRLCSGKERVIEWFLPITDNKVSPKLFIRIFESEIFDPRSRLIRK